MSTGDFQFYTEGPFGNPGTTRYAVAPSGGAPQINAGEPVVASGASVTATVVATMATNKPLLGTDFIVGISQSVSSETTTLTGVVDVYNIFSEDASLLVNANDSTAVNTQAKYNALVGRRVLIDKTSGVYTALVTDGVGNGCVILPLDTAKWPGKVRLQFRKSGNWFAGVTAAAANA